MIRVTALAAASNQVRIPARLSEKKAHASTATLTAAAQAAALARADNDCIQCSVRLARPSPLCLLRSFTQSSSQRMCSGSPDGIRTRATALRGRRARPLHNGALERDETSAERTVAAGTASCAGVLGLEPRLTEPESVGLPITPYPMGARPCWADGSLYPSRRRGVPNATGVSRPDGRSAPGSGRSVSRRGPASRSTRTAAARRAAR